MKPRDERAAILGVKTPKREDVLFGRGPSNARHNATTLWWSLVQHYAAEYRLASSRQAKARIVQVIIGKVNKAGGRFLEKRGDHSTSKADAVWDETEIRLAQLKTSQALRDVRTDLQQPPLQHGTVAPLVEPPLEDFHHSYESTDTTFPYEAVALPLREQLSGSSHEWVANLWSSTKRKPINQGLLVVAGDSSCGESHEHPLRKRKERNRCTHDSFVPAKKCMHHMATKSSPCTLVLQEQLSGDSQAWVSCESLMDTTRPQGLDSNLSCCGAGAVPSPVAGDASVELIESDHPESLPFPMPLDLENATEGCQTGKAAAFRLSKVHADAYDETHHEHVDAVQNASLGQLGVMSELLDDLKKSTKMFQHVMAEAMDVEKDFHALLLKSSGSCKNFIETQVEIASV